MLGHVFLFDQMLENSQIENNGKMLHETVLELENNNNKNMITGTFQGTFPNKK